jgi:hypothetical protein
MSNRSAWINQSGDRRHGLLGAGFARNLIKIISTQRREGAKQRRNSISLRLRAFALPLFLSRRQVVTGLRGATWLFGAAWIVAVAGCNETSTQQSVKTRPSELPGPAVPSPLVPESAPQSRPEPEHVPTTGKAEAPASRPAKPESTYDSSPPYPVSLFVESPEDKQPGWLKVEKLADDKQMATVKGRFPEQNRIYVDTTNVRRIRIHVGHLPLAPNERVILQIDKQGMVLSRGEPFVTLNRLQTGEWVVEKQKK